jgi:hypothetical protein
MGPSRVVAALASSAFVACSLVVSTDGLSGGAATPDAAPGEAGADAPYADDGAPPADAAFDGDAALTRGCAALSPAPKFCDDFERESVLGSWDGLDAPGGGSAVIDHTDSWSPTRSLLCTTPAVTGSDLWASLARAFPGAAMSLSDVSVRFQERIAAKVEQGQFDLMRLELIAPGDTVGHLTLAITLRPTEVIVNENDYRVSPAVYHGHTFARMPAYGAWEAFALHVALTGTPHVTVTLGTDIVVNADLLSPKVAPSALVLHLGVFESTGSGGGPRTVHIDDVVVDY